MREEAREAALELREHPVAHGLPAVADHALRDVVAVLGLGQAQDVAVELLADRALLLRRPALDAALHDAARVVAEDDLVHLAAHRRDNLGNEDLAPLQGRLALAQLVPLQDERLDELVVRLRELAVGAHLLQ